MTSIFKGRGGFTLIELLVVVGMIAVIMGAITTSVASARERSRSEKARTEVKSIAQAILSLENYKENLSGYACQNQKISGTLLMDLTGKGTAANGGSIPVLLQASMAGGGELRDPWGRPYVVTIREGAIPRSSISNIKTGFMLPNYNRLSKAERE